MSSHVQSQHEWVEAVSDDETADALLALATTRSGASLRSGGLPSQAVVVSVGTGEHLTAPSPPPPTGACGSIGGVIATSRSAGCGEQLTGGDDASAEGDSRVCADVEATLSLLQVDDEYDAQLHHHSASSAGASTGGRVVSLYRHYTPHHSSGSTTTAAHSKTSLKRKKRQQQQPASCCEEDDTAGRSSDMLPPYPNAGPGLGNAFASDDTASRMLSDASDCNNGEDCWRDDAEETEVRVKLEKALRDQQRSREEELLEIQRVYTKAMRKTFRSLRGMPEPSFDTPTALYEEELDAASLDMYEALGGEDVAGSYDARNDLGITTASHADCQDDAAMVASVVDHMERVQGGCDVRRTGAVLYPADGTHIHTTHGGGSRGAGGIIPSRFVSRLRNHRADDDSALRAEGCDEEEEE